MKYHRQRILVCIVGLLTVAILLEAGLYVMGYFYKKHQNGYKVSDYPLMGHSYTILCLGNSWTLGSGAPIGMSYPDHLRSMLNQTFKDKDIKVINAGIGRVNSAEILDRLKPQINSIKPDLIILRAGEPNSFNSYKYSQYLKRENKIKNPFYRFMFSVNDFLYAKSRIYRLAQLLINDISEKNKPVFSCLHENPTVPSEEQVFADNQEDIERHMLYNKFRSQEGQEGYKKAIELGNSSFRLHDLFFEINSDIMPASESEIDEAIYWLEIVEELTPGSCYNYMLLGSLHIFKKDFKKATEYFIKSARINPTVFMDNRTGESFFGLRIIYKEVSDPEIKHMIEVFAEELKEVNPDAADIFLWIDLKKSQAKLITWLDSDIKEMVKIIRANGINLILQNYPPQTFSANISPQRTLVNSILRKNARELHIPFVDNEKLFLQIFKHGRKHEDYYEKIIGNILGNHCNAKGYRVMAKFLYDKILEEGFIGDI
jgi:lysophospholipase L1-like esterase